MIFGCCSMCRHKQRSRQTVVKADMSPDNASILVCGGGGIALDVTRKLKDMGAWVWMLQRSDSRRCVHAPTLCTSLRTFSFHFWVTGYVIQWRWRVHALLMYSLFAYPDCPLIWFGVNVYCLDAVVFCATAGRQCMLSTSFAYTDAGS